ncbi:MAG: hypothetical protein CVT82_11105 [Alphaproteobacteria bacterium HGW-Alphaproteobacteria-4]|jgi:hypothetical protein|nr:MAG: hypothetical protein CVT82_11105 [Alphaproteobacteria bacterium HGW-Alphaproteobacteria-4]
MTTLLRAAKATQKFSLAAATLLASTSFATALTETTTAKTGRPAGIVISFDWRAGKSGQRAGAAVPVSASISSGLNLGGGSYVCSPAGFGRQSQCFSR